MSFLDGKQIFAKEIVTERGLSRYVRLDLKKKKKLSDSDSWHLYGETLSL